MPPRVAPEPAISSTVARVHRGATPCRQAGGVGREPWAFCPCGCFASPPGTTPAPKLTRAAHSRCSESCAVRRNIPNCCTACGPHSTDQATERAKRREGLPCTPLKSVCHWGRPFQRRNATPQVLDCPCCLSNSTTDWILYQSESPGAQSTRAIARRLLCLSLGEHWQLL